MSHCKHVDFIIFIGSKLHISTRRIHTQICFSPFKIVYLLTLENPSNFFYLGEIILFFFMRFNQWSFPSVLSLLFSFPRILSSSGLQFSLNLSKRICSSDWPWFIFHAPDGGGDPLKKIHAGNLIKCNKLAVDAFLFLHVHGDCLSYSLHKL